MCMLCVTQNWSRRVAAMLPWLVLPLIVIWSISQFLPPALRFEITSPRLACILVLLVTLFWYEILMPQLSAWQVSRNARIRERKRVEAIELQKLRKTAIRRCRNCSSPYKDQNPGGGRFMCSTCGHVSKRPVLDFSPLSNVGNADTAISKKDGWMCRQDWLENGSWVGGSFAGKCSYWKKNMSVIFGSKEFFFVEKFYSGVLRFVCKLLASLFMSIQWFWRKLLRVNPLRDDSSSDAARKMLAETENGGNYHESRGEKARRKAEEKRQVRLEKELLEEEEKKQKEEVAMLVEEQRRIRDEKLEAEKEHGKISVHGRVNKTDEKKRQERRKKKDKRYSKSNADAEELEKKACKQDECKQDSEKKSHNNLSEQSAGLAQERKNGILLSSSKAFSGGSSIKKGAKTSNTVTSENKLTSSTSKVHTSVQKRALHPQNQISGKPSMSGDHKSLSSPVHSGPPLPRTPPKKSWQQLFTSASSSPTSSHVNVISRANSKPQPEIQSTQLHGQPTTQSFDNPVSFGFPSLSCPSVSSGNCLGFSSTIEPVIPFSREGSNGFIPEDVFKDPCYIPDPTASLLGPVSKSLDGFHQGMGLEVSRSMQKLSPIESPLSRLRTADEKLILSKQFSRTPNIDKLQRSQRLARNDANGDGIWQMLNSSPRRRDNLNSTGGSASLFPPQLIISNKDEYLHPSCQQTMGSMFNTQNGTCYNQNIFLDNSQIGGPLSHRTGFGDPHRHPWSPNAHFPPICGSDVYFPCKPPEERSPSYARYEGPGVPAANFSPQISPEIFLARNKQAIPFSGEGIPQRAPPLTIPRVARNLFQDPVWSMD